MNHNINLALNIINYLYSKGFSNYCIAPGSRSAPLAIALNLLKKNMVNINIHIHFDERALGFLGLGLAKGCNEPVVIITTSGSAVANLFPAIMEAYYTHTELLLLTADRPYELHECGANQTCKQSGIFGNYTLSDDIPTFSEHIPANTIINRIDKILNKNKYLNIPIHLNISFREPLYNSNLNEYMNQNNNIVNYNNPIYNTNIETNVTSDLDFDNLFNNSIIIIGHLNYNDSLVINEIINKTKEYTILDIQSNLRHNQSDFIVKNFDFLSKEQIDYLHSNYKKIIVISGKFISQKILKFINDFKYDTYFISKNFDNYNSISKNSINMHISYTELNRKLHKNNKANKTPIIGAYHLEDKWDELSVIKLLANSYEDTLFLGNSTVCRYADALLSNINKKIYTNRGVSGIDGLIATSCGLSYTQNIISVIGDTTALYDLSSLSLLKKYRIKLLIINNNGGNIFEKFPIPYEIKQELFLNPHNIKFEKLAESFEIKYFSPQNLLELDSIISSKFNESIIIELNFPTFESIRKFSSL